MTEEFEKKVISLLERLAEKEEQKGDKEALELIELAKKAFEERTAPKL